MLVDRLLSILSRLPRRRVGGEGLRLNLGSGTSVAPGWVNLDLSPNALISAAPAIVLRALYRASGSRHLMSSHQYVARLKSSRFVFCDLAHGIPVADAAAQIVYSSHFVEHLSSSEARMLLRESFRVLAPGGIIRITVPDLQHFAIDYAAGKQPRFINFLEGDHGYDGPRARHLSFWDGAALETALRETGFVDITRLDHHRGVTPDLEIIETHADPGGLYMEARRP